jgi:hypothetical protein
MYVSVALRSVISHCVYLIAMSRALDVEPLFKNEWSTAVQCFIGPALRLSALLARMPCSSTRLILHFLSRTYRPPNKIVNMELYQMRELGDLRDVGIGAGVALGGWGDVIDLDHLGKSRLCACQKHERIAWRVSP